jgi:hypothetical protein
MAAPTPVLLRILLPLAAGCALLGGCTMRDGMVMEGDGSLSSLEAQVTRFQRGRGALRAVNVKLGAFARNEVVYDEVVNRPDRFVTRRAHDLVAVNTVEIDYRAGVGFEFAF